MFDYVMIGAIGDGVTLYCRYPGCEEPSTHLRLDDSSEPHEIDGFVFDASPVCYGHATKEVQ